MKVLNHAPIRSTGLLGSTAAVLLLTVSARADLEQPASWSPPATPEVRAAVIALLEERSADAETRARVEQLWADPPEDADLVSLLGRLAATCALLEPAAGELVEFCDNASEVVALPEFAILRDPQQPVLVRNNLRLLYGRWLAQHEFYDEAIEQLEELAPQDVVDPAALLFYLMPVITGCPTSRSAFPPSTG